MTPGLLAQMILGDIARKGKGYAQSSDVNSSLNEVVALLQVNYGINVDETTQVEATELAIQQLTTQGLYRS